MTQAEWNAKITAEVSQLVRQIVNQQRCENTMAASYDPLRVNELECRAPAPKRCIHCGAYFCEACFEASECAVGDGHETEEEAAACEKLRGTTISDLMELVERHEA